MTKDTPGILIAEDSPPNIQVISEMLKEAGYKVHLVSSGRQALQAAATHPPELILLDISLPEMDGYEVCERLKANDRLADIPVIFISALSEQLDKVAVPDHILLKPGKLTDEEFETIKRHPVLGADALAAVYLQYPNPLVKMGMELARSHHERWDGTGYPGALSGTDIPLAGRITMLADQYDAIRTVRPYKPAVDAARTRAIIIEGDGRCRFISTRTYWRPSRRSRRISIGSTTNSRRDRRNGDLHMYVSIVSKLNYATAVSVPKPCAAQNI